MTAENSVSHRFCLSVDVPEGTAKSGLLAELPVAVCRLEGRLAAFSALCPHLRADLSGGMVRDGGITCPDHLWHFDLSSGQCALVPGAKVTLYPVREEGEWIMVELPS